MNPSPLGTPPPDVLARSRLICLEFPEAHEETAWAGIRWNFRPVWFPNIAGVRIDARTDWDELEGLLKESYRVLAPARLAALVE
jgi:hypothetical protein